MSKVTVKRRWFQLRLSSLLVLVTLAAVGADYGRRRLLLLGKAHEHERQAAAYDSKAQFASLLQFTLRYDYLAEHHRQCRDKYKRAAWFPWLPIAPNRSESEIIDSSDCEVDEFFRSLE